MDFSFSNWILMQMPGFPFNNKHIHVHGILLWRADAPQSRFFPVEMRPVMSLGTFGHRQVKTNLSPKAASQP